MVQAQEMLVLHRQMPAELRGDGCKRIQYQASSIEVIVQPLERSDIRTVDSLTKQTQDRWSQLTETAEMRDFWLETFTDHVASDLSVGPDTVALRMICLGTLTSPGTFSRHWNSEPPEAAVSRECSTNTDDWTSAVEVQYDNELITIERGKSSTTESWHMELSFDSLADRTILVSSNGSTDHLYLLLRNQPKLFHCADAAWKRAVSFASCKRHVVGSSDVIRLEVDPLARDGLDKLLQRLTRHGFSIYRGTPTTSDALEDRRIQWPKFETFEATYAWYCLTTQGFKVTDQVSDEVVEFLQTDPDSESLVARLLNTLGEYFDNHCIVRLTGTVLRREWNTLLQYRNVDDDEEQRQLEHLVKVRRLLLTPTALRALPAEHTVGNRVVREFGVDRFLRVVVRDEDMQLLNSSAQSVETPVQELVEFLRRDLAIGDGRSYHFLGCSNSQMRLHGFWMYASDGEYTVDDIRRWMGDLSHEHCVATYMSRLGQFFSASKKAVHVDENSKQLIPDVTRNGHCFTDGIGKVSTTLAKKITDSLKASRSPSAFQIRYGGCKGVVSVCPELHGDQLHVRKSMEKFTSDHHDLEVVQHTNPGRLYLNRQVIVLMSGLGVPDQAFFALQDKMLQQLAFSRLREHAALDALSQIHVGLTRRELLGSGVCVTTEPFLSSLLRNIYEYKLNGLMQKTRIEISTDDGRIMMGTADETGRLEYGQVFAQYSVVHIDGPSSETRVLTGPVVIAKNPCFHPGDMRKFTAVDIPELRHMIDCVVFPTRGSRPHPDEMSGSDLDGDMYFVCWRSALLPPGENKGPMDYESKNKDKLSRPITEIDMVEFFGDYIEGDKIGVIANSHLAHADGQKDGIFSQECLDLSQMHSDAVDFPKTGYHVEIPLHLRPRQYPHYMLKRDKPTTKSRHVLGKLFDQCQSVMRDQAAQTEDPRSTHAIDEQFLAPGYETYLVRAATIHDYYRRSLSKIMTEYGISTEAETITGHIVKLKNRRRGTLQSEHVEVAEVIDSRLKATKARVKSMFLDAVDGQPRAHYDELCRLASAIYYTSYNTDQGEKACLSLPWIFGSHLLSARKLKFEATTALADRSSIRPSQAPSVLQQLSTVVAESTEIDDQPHERRCRAFHRLASVLSSIRKEQVGLCVFGSHATGFDNVYSSLDVFVDARSPGMPQKFLDEIVSVLKRERTYDIVWKPGRQSELKPIVVRDKLQDVKLCLYDNHAYLNRTAYIIAETSTNRWIVPVLRTLMSWGNQSSVIGNEGRKMIRGEQLIMLFLSYCLENVQEHEALDHTERNRVKGLIASNHFLDCAGTICSHVKKPNEAVESASVGAHGEKLEGDRYADVILDFLSRSSCLQGDVLKEVVDPSYEDGKTKVLSLKQALCRRLAERMLKAYHTLAQKGRLSGQISASVRSDNHLLVDLPRQLCGLIDLLFAETTYAENLQNESRADQVVIRRRPYRGVAVSGLVLEARGSDQSLQLLRDIISVDTKHKSSMLDSGGSHLVAKNAYVTIFKQCSDHPTPVTCHKYSGPCHPYHDKKRRHLPRLSPSNPNPDNTVDRHKFVEHALKQFELVDAYHEGLFGELRGLISYGTLYVVNWNGQRILDTDIDEMFSRRDSSGVADGTPPWRSGRAKWRPSCPDDNFWASFIPASNPELGKSRLESWLGDKGFVLTEENVEYRLSLKLNISGQLLNFEGDLVLDGDFNLKRFAKSPVTWLSASIVSADKDSRYKPYDCRFKIQSCSELDIDELARESDDIANIIARHGSMLQRSGNELRGVHEDFLSRIRFVRKKHTKMYRVPENERVSSADEFLRQVAVRINYGTEYSRPSKTGHFQKIDRDRVEVSAVPDFPHCAPQDPDAIRSFLNNVWQLAENLGSILA